MNIIAPSDAPVVRNRWRDSGPWPGRICTPRRLTALRMFTTGAGAVQRKS